MKKLIIILLIIPLFTFGQVLDSNGKFIKTTKYANIPTSTFDDSGIARLEPTFPTYSGDTLTVGSAGTYSLIGDALNAASDGDIIEILNDFNLDTESAGYLYIDQAKSLKIKGTNPSIKLSSTNGVYCTRINRIIEITFEDLIIESTSQEIIDFQSGDNNNNSVYINNCEFITTNELFQYTAGSTYKTDVYMKDSKVTLNRTTGYGFVTLDCQVPQLIYFSNCEFDVTAPGFLFYQNDINYATKSYFYGCKINLTGESPIFRINKDTSVPTVYGSECDLRDSEISYLDGYSGTCLLFGRGSTNIKFINNTVNVPNNGTALGAGIALKSIGGTSIIKGNNITAARCIYIKGGSDIDIEYNSLINNGTDLGTSTALQILNASEDVDLNCSNITFKYNNVLGNNFAIYANSLTSESINTTKSTWTFDNNIYYNRQNNFNYFVNFGVETYLWNDRTSFWTDDANSTFNWFGKPAIIIQ